MKVFSIHSQLAVEMRYSSNNVQSQLLNYSMRVKLRH